jgi:hypothetical protein
MSIKNQLISGRVPVTTAANVAADRYQYLDLSSAEPNLGTANTGDVLIYNSSFPGGRKWVPQAEIRGSIGEAAYVEANTASANTLYLSGVDLAQNNRITVIEGVNDTQNTRLSIIEGVDLGQNTRMSIIEGVDLWQNTRITAVDTFTQSAYNTANTKFNSSGGTITGSVTISANNDLTVTGNLTVLGNTFSVGTQTLEVVDPMIVLGIGNYTTDAVDIGIVGHYNAGSNAHTGLIRDYATKNWYLFQGYTPELSGNNDLDINHASFDTANLIAKQVTANVVASTVTINGRDQASVDATQNTNITAVNTYAASAYGLANTNSGLITVIQGVDTAQNTRMSIIEGVDTTQNTRLTIIEGVDAGQNTRMGIIEGVDTTQNTNITIATNAATAAFAQANATAGGLTSANTRLTIAEGVDATQNANITVIQGVDVWQNTQITSINSLAQAAFNKANTGARATASNTAPTGNTVGDLWLSLTDETLYMYSYDGVSNNWIDISGPILISSNILVQYTITANVS